MGRRLVREKVLQILFQIDVGGIEPEKAIAHVLEEEKLPPKDIEFARSLVMGTLNNLEQVDRLISLHAKDWSLSRIANVDRSILRMAVYEMLFEPEIPASVSINEAIELAKVFGSDESGAFVNGLLDQVRRFLDTEHREVLGGQE
ncbi:MAG: transcription antitermination factor NusB [Clostridia bacterium]|nr:transcription antitermination factor NusB [Clostridia bacterium]